MAMNADGLSKITLAFRDTVAVETWRLKAGELKL